LLEIHFFQTCLGEYHTLESFFRLFNSIAIQLYVPHKIDKFVLRHSLLIGYNLEGGGA